jgi:hypothetical protein
MRVAWDETTYEGAGTFTKGRPVVTAHVGLVLDRAPGTGVWWVLPDGSTDRRAVEVAARDMQPVGTMHGSTAIRRPSSRRAS